MKIRSLFVAVVFLAGGLFVFMPMTVSACSCLPSDSLKEDIKNSETVFRGVVMSADGRVDDVKSSDPSGNVIYTVAVSEVWKGDVLFEERLSTMPSSAACGVNLELGVQYVFFAGERRDNGYYGIGLCSSRRVFERLSVNELEVLGSGEVPESELSSSAGSGVFLSGNRWILAGVGALTLLLVGSVGWMLLSTRTH